MSQTTLVATPRTGKGSSIARRLRSEGHIPGILYGRGMEPISVTVERREFRLALSGPAGVNTVLALQVGGESYPAVIKEMQRHPIKRSVSHVDFLQVNMNEEITVHIPVRLHGEAKAVAAAGGLVDPTVDALEVSCTPTNMPNEFMIDISDMQPDTVIRLSDIPMPKGVTPLGDPDMPVVTILTTAAEIEEPAAAEGEEAEGEGEGEGEAAAQGEGGGSSAAAE
ncbi:MAG TPA: 50S ribosomal protein L25 [Ilumatobacteraceae bacterium]|nr:50S ribosomal protein L25 [Ilumatobacteraceae bacterium]